MEGTSIRHLAWSVEELSERTDVSRSVVAIIVSDEIADDTGGDFYDWKKLPDERWVVILADVDRTRHRARNPRVGMPGVLASHV